MKTTLNFLRFKNNFNLISIAAFTLTACSKDNDDNTQEPAPTIFEMGYGYSDVTTNNDYALNYQSLLTPEVNQLENASGLAGSNSNNNLVLIVEGRNNPAAVQVFNRDGVFQGKITLVGADNVDWQDIATGPGPVEGQNYVYVGDIGDRSANREFLSIFRFIEPDLSNPNAPFDISISEFDRIDFSITSPRDCETLMLDPLSKDLIVMGKMQAMVYRIPFPQNTSGVTKAQFKGHHRLRREIKAGDISPDGRFVIIKDVGEIFQWEVPPGHDPIAVIFQNTPQRVAYQAEIEGGALGWTADGNNYFTLTDTDKRDGMRRGQPILFGYTRN